MRLLPCAIAATFVGAVACVAGCELFYPMGGYAGAADAGAGEGGGACDAGFCACLTPRPAFCDDFDHGPLGAAWDASPAPEGNGALALDPSRASSLPNSLRAAFPSTTGASAYLAEGITRDFAQARLDLDLFVPAGFTDDQVASFFLASGHSLALVVTGSTVYAYESWTGAGPGDNPFPLAAPVPAKDAWVHVTLLFRPATAANGHHGLLRLAFGDLDAGAPVYDHETDAGAAVEVRVGGVFVQGSAGGWSANFDDVVLRLD